MTFAPKARRCMTNPIETGIVVAALTIVVVALKLVENFMARRNGKSHLIVDCPNKIESLAENVHDLNNACARMASDARLTQAGVATLVKQHEAVGGVEQWKITPELKSQIKTAVSQLGETLVLQKQQLRYMERMVKLQDATVSILKKNGSNHGRQ